MSVYYTTNKTQIEQLLAEDRAVLWADSFLPIVETGAIQNIDGRFAHSIEGGTYSLYGPLLRWFEIGGKPARYIVYLEENIYSVGYAYSGSVFRNEYKNENCFFIGSENMSVGSINYITTKLSPDAMTSKINTPTSNQFYKYDFSSAFPKHEDITGVVTNYGKDTSLNTAGLPNWTTTKEYMQGSVWGNISKPDNFGGYSMIYASQGYVDNPPNGVYEHVLYNGAGFVWDNPLRDEFFADNYKDTREQMVRVRNGQKRLAVYRPYAGFGTYWDLTFNGASVSGDVGYLSDRVYFNIPITHNYEQALEYINGGQLPDDVEYYYLDLDNPPSGSDTSETDPLDDYDNPDGDNFIDTPVNVPDLTATDAVSVNTYVVSNAELGAFVDWFWSTTEFDWNKIIDSVTGLYGNLSQAVMSLKLFPFPISDVALLANQSIMAIGRYELEQTCRIVSGVTKVLEFGTIKIPKKFNAFPDFYPFTTIVLFLPYHGYINLDTNKYMGKDLTIKASVDITTGSLQYMLFVQGTMLDTVTCKVGMDIPFSLDNAMDNQKDIIQSAIKTGADLFTGNVLGTVADLASFELPPISTNSSVSPGTAMWTYQKPFLIIQRPQYNRPSNYTHIYGVPSYRALKLGDISGYTEIDNPILGKSDRMTDKENEMILSLLKGGIYL